MKQDGIYRQTGKKTAWIHAVVAWCLALALVIPFVHCHEESHFHSRAIQGVAHDGHDHSHGWDDHGHAHYPADPFTLDRWAAQVHTHTHHHPRHVHFPGSLSPMAVRAWEPPDTVRAAAPAPGRHQYRPPSAPAARYSDLPTQIPKTRQQRYIFDISHLPPPLSTA